jgi:hypothetical protein
MFEDGDEAFHFSSSADTDSDPVFIPNGKSPQEHALGLKSLDRIPSILVDLEEDKVRLRRDIKKSFSLELPAEIALSFDGFPANIRVKPQITITGDGRL